MIGGTTGQKARTWLGTLNNPDVDPSDYLSAWADKARYVCGQLEEGKEGTRHIQFYLNFKEPVRLSALKKKCGKAHFDMVKVDNGADTYCMKEDTRVAGPWEYGQKPLKRNSKTDWDKVWEDAKAGNLGDIPSDIRVRCYH
jgi:hypothetical protein